MNVKTVTVAQPSSAAREISIVVAASLFVAISAHISLPLPFSPVPFTMQNLAVLLVGLTLGPTRGFAALALYLGEGAVGLPCFAPGAGGLAQLLGPTGGYLMAYPLVAYIAGAIFAQARQQRFLAALAASFIAEIVLFSAGTIWLTVYTHSLLQAALWGLVPFLPIEVLKMILAATVAARIASRKPPA